MRRDQVKERIRQMVLLGIKQFGDPYYQGFAAQIAFFVMLSLVPTIIVITQLLGFLNINNLDFLEDWIDKYITSDMGNTIKGLLRNHSSVGNNIVLTLLALWAASRAQFAMMRIANYTYSSSRTTGNFWTERLRSLRTMVLTILTFAFVIVVLVYGKKILYIFVGGVVEEYKITMLWTMFRWPLIAVLYFLVIMLNYYVMPVERLSLRDLLPGSVFGSLGLLIVTFFYVVYTQYIVNYNIIYGSMSSVVALMFWFYFLAWVLVLGVLVNKVFRDTRRKR
ncbi:hypothetical protein BHK98_01045 [Hornefia porci]|uniref:Uncharacterized protein n=1 Tax=Hornefia porci TaxID=2652292 RepID=A0A1Q9JEY0_9FIRM|nr:YihY/virulence factor BrkB family protein [Hornefia porci]OLR54790.1 hypothetical protein BHK98_01045 [Hornefia porci]